MRVSVSVRVRIRVRVRVRVRQANLVHVRLQLRGHQGLQASATSSLRADPPHEVVIRACCTVPALPRSLCGTTGVMLSSWHPAPRLWAGSVCGESPGARRPEATGTGWPRGPMGSREGALAGSGHAGVDWSLLTCVERVRRRRSGPEAGHRSRPCKGLTAFLCEELRPASGFRCSFCRLSLG